jgi:hypothetical protein
MAGVMAALLMADKPPQDEIEEAVARYSKVKNMIETEAGALVLKMHTTGAQP